MTAGFTKSFGQTVTANEMVFTPTDIDTLFTARGINPPDGIPFRVYIQRKSGATVTIGELLPTDVAIVFSYSTQTFFTN